MNAATAALLDEHATRSGTSDWAYAARLVRDVVTAPVVDPEQLWSEVVASVGETIASRQQRSCLDRMWIDTVVGSTVLLVVPDAYSRDVVELRLRPAIAEALSRALGRRMQVAVTIEEEPQPQPKPVPVRSRAQDRARRETLEQAFQLARELADHFASASTSMSEVRSAGRRPPTGVRRRAAGAGRQAAGSGARRRA